MKSAVLVLWVSAFALTAQTFTTLHIFQVSDGQWPVGTLVQGFDGNLYGTTSGGGALSQSSIFGGTVFLITPDGALTTLYNFCSLSGCADGWQPEGALIQVSRGDFYGTTLSGGASNQGTIFKMTPDGTPTTLSNFCRLDA